MFGSLDISTSALVAQRTRMETISANLANKDTILNPKNEYEPYRRRMVVFGEGDARTGKDGGVHVQEILLDDAPFKKFLDPSNKFADEEGYIYKPNIDSAIEQINALEAARSYEANITAAEATKSMLQTSLRLLA
ncbi:Flagellar basal-body rod protein FlgC [Poriferisphaera corsica]|uniref:Flagellar basal-body rod protein FlgC n=1 Tax=Poriferisphaera corsica TaxID=2528020 RepID=A0A517YSE6_9BACT|nr:flagellar basal body rod protein FlgC [Poriferisphaera corsica]QDU33163.1 Flagellar basal-body rod protein FlgC [Poriferisphaera corsica]